MGEILFLAHRIPFPPDRGDKIRSHHLLKALARLAPVHVGCFGDTPGDFDHEGELADVAASHFLVRRGANLALPGLRALWQRKPVSLTAFDSAELRGWVERTLHEREVATIFVFSGQMGQYVPEHFSGRVIVDLCDVDSAKFDAYAAERRGPRAWTMLRESRLLAAEESRLARRADRTLLISDAEAELFRTRGNADAAISVVGNGIDSGSFYPAATASHPGLAAPAGPQLVFTGQMDYPPNVAAALRVAERILPAVIRIHPGAQFHVVGRAPTRELTALGGKGGVRVWGQVPDVRSFLAAADLVVAPLAIARGVQNKVLEAMAMARPVLLTSEAATGIAARNGEHFAVADSDDALAARALELLADTPAALRMGAAARRFVVERQSWEAMLAPLPGLLGFASPERALDAA
ncbi:MAG: TIGR03087 family PEP-CTERM/XrtA system glycosyltransferase [Tsuneonella sp.]